MRNAQVNVVTPTREPKAQSLDHEDKSEWLQTRPGERCRIRVSAADTSGARAHRHDGHETGLYVRRVAKMCRDVGNGNQRSQSPRHQD
jgi:hypothetical protein